MAFLLAALAALKTPAPEPPAAWYTMSAPFWYMPSAAVLPLAGSPKPLKSGGWVRYWTSILMLGLTALAPAS